MKPKILLALLFVSRAALAADPALLKLAPENAGVIAGFAVAQGQQSPLGRYVLDHAGRPHTGMEKLLVENGFDARRDVSEIILVLREEIAGQNPRSLLLARGQFDPARIEAAVIAQGGSVVSFHGVNLLSLGEKNPGRVLAFLDGATAAIGDMGLVEEAIERRAASAAAASWSSLAQTLSAANDFWFLTNGSIATLASAIPGGELGNGDPSAMFQAVTQASGGLKLGDPIVFSADAVTRSEKDAESLAGLMRFFSSMILANRNNNPTASRLAGLLNSLVMSTSSNIMHLSLQLPEAQVESFLEAEAQSRKLANHAQ